MPSAVNTEEVRVCKFLRAPREAVYEAWLDPEVRRKWWAADLSMRCTSCDIDATVGGSYRVAMSNPKHGPDAPSEPAEYVVGGRFTELSPHGRMAFTWAWEDGPGAGFDSTVTLDFFEATDEEGQPATELVLTHTGLPSPFMRSEHCAGWIGCLRTLGYHFHDTWPAGHAPAAV